MRKLAGWRPAGPVEPLLERVGREQGGLARAGLERVLAGDPVVFTGQQPVLGGGPMFVWLKAFAAVREAERASSLLGRPVRPLFWIAGDDADLDEVRFAADPLRQETLDAFPGLAAGAPVGGIPFPVGRAEALEATLRGWWSDLPVGAMGGARDLSGSMAAALRLWFGDALLVVDAGWPELRALAGEAYQAFAAHPSDLHAPLSRGMEEAREAGVAVGIGSWPDRARLFRVADGIRRRLVLRDGAWRDGAGWAIEPFRLAAAVRERPQDFSHDVVSRPFAAEAVLPVLLHVLGPGEFAYFACLGPLARSLGRTLAPAVPRASCLLLPEGPWSPAREARWDPADPPPPFSQLEDRFLRANHPQVSLWAKTWSDARADYLETLGQGGLAGDLAGLERRLEGFESRLLRERLRRFRPDHGPELAELRRLWILAGGGAPQERVWSPWGLAHHLGAPGLLPELAELLDPADPNLSVWEVSP